MLKSTKFLSFILTFTTDPWLAKNGLMLLLWKLNLLFNICVLFKSCGYLFHVYALSLHWRNIFSDGYWNQLLKWKHEWRLTTECRYTRYTHNNIVTYRWHIKEIVFQLLAETSSFLLMLSKARVKVLNVVKIKGQVVGLNCG